MEDYRRLEERFQKVYRLQHFIHLSTWDTRVNLTSKGAPSRGAAVGELKRVIQSLLLDPEVAQWATVATPSDHNHVNDNNINNNLEVGFIEQGASAVERANLREVRRVYHSEAALPAAFLQQKAQVISKATGVWSKARQENNFALYLPVLKDMVEVMREEAVRRTEYQEALTGVKASSVYEALFHLFEPCLPLQAVEELFEDIKTWLPSLLSDILAAQEARTLRGDIDRPELALLIPKEQQLSLVKECLGECFQFDFESSRVDCSPHPFTSLMKEESRITTHYSETNYTKMLFAAIHESGHARYERECGPREKLGQPVCNARSLMMHESQSRLFEVMIGRSGDFAACLLPHLRRCFSQHQEETVFSDADCLKQWHQYVRPGLVRLEADEVSYPLHILLRYEMERDLIEGTLEVEEVPRVWNRKMKEYLGLDPGDRDDLGCLQDMHWSQGFFGYFPTYTLGSMFAAQLMHHMKETLGAEKVREAIREGKLDPIFDQLREKIWEVGCLYETEELMVRSTGEKLQSRYFREHLERRYLLGED